MSFLKAIKIPYSHVSSVEEYFALPKSEREWGGLYKIPYALPWEKFNSSDSEGWDTFYAKIKKEYPIQYFFRRWIPSLDNPITYFSIKYFVWPLQELKYCITRFIKPCHPRWRRVLPRHRYGDIANLIVDSNFALIQDFYHEEVVDGWVVWTSDEVHKTFHNTLVNYVNWIENERAVLDDKIAEAYNTVHEENSSESYRIKYAEPHNLEKLKSEKETEILKWYIDNREFFWT